MPTNIQADGSPVTIKLQGETTIVQPEEDTETEQTVEQVTKDGVVHVGPKGNYESVATAFSENAPSGGSDSRPRFHIMPEYTPSAEPELPVELTYKTVISGDRTPINLPDGAKGWLKLFLTGNRSRGVKMEDLTIFGGDSQLIIDSSRFGVYEGVSFRGANGTAVQFASTKNENGDLMAPNTHTFDACDWEDNSIGISVPQRVAAHELKVYESTMLDNDNYHIWASQIANLVVSGTGLQKAGKSAIMARGCMSPVVENCYIEDNCLKDNSYYHLFFNNEGANQRCTAVSVKDNYFNGWDGEKAVGAVHFGSQACESADVRGNDFRNFKTKAVSVFDGNHKIDVHAESNTFEDVPNKYGTDDNASMVLSDGVVGAHQDGVDLTKDVFNGEYVRPGLRGLYKGDAAPNGMAVYLNGEWQSQVNGETIQ